VSTDICVFDERKNWLEARGRGLGGTDTSAIVNLNPWKRPIDVYLNKLGLDDQREPTEAMFWGSYLERGVAQLYATRTGCALIPPELMGDHLRAKFPGMAHEVLGKFTLLNHADLPFVLGTPDMLARDWPRGVEIKTCGHKTAEWGKEGTDEVPVHYRIQVAQYMAITGFDVWDIAALFSGNRLEIFPIGRDRPLEDQLLNHAADFWHKHVEARLEPTLDESESWKRHLGKLYAIGNQDFIEPDPAIDEAATALKEAQQAICEAEQLEALAKNRLAQLIGTNKGAKLTAGGKVQWIRSRPSMVTDWETLCGKLNATPEQITEHTKPQSRAPYVRLYGAAKP
jgi:predicted phage-related endonuclease